jgi:MscS family membrane protein
MNAICVRLRWMLGVLLAVMLSAPIAQAQATAPPASAPPPGPAQPPAEPADALGRDTPRGTVLGFMTAARKNNFEAAVLYLHADARETGLAHQLYVVLDSRLPARLFGLSDRPEGSLANPLKPELDVVGTITTNEGPLDLIVERVTTDSSNRVWLFSRQTLDAIPAVYDEVHLVAPGQYLPGVLTRPRIFGIRLFEWLIFFAIPLIYRGLGLLGALIAPVVDVWRRRHGMTEATGRRLPGSVRLILIAAAIRWMLVSVDLPLFERQFWLATARLLTTSGLVWQMLLLNAFGERYVHKRLQSSSSGDLTALLRLARRVADVLIVATGWLIIFAYFGIDPTAALAGLGIGGIAVALSAQKTLENVIGGLSIIFDKAVRVGDFVKVGDTAGTVDYIGLRSTRIRTVDRTMLSVPNGQIANINIETVSARDKFRFNHFVGLGYQTTAAQMRTIVAELTGLLRRHPLVDDSSIRARFIRLGPSSIDVEVFAYLFARDWPHFLEVQEELLLDLMEIVEHAGATIAYPSQTLYLADTKGSLSDPPRAAALAGMGSSGKTVEPA